MSTELSKQVHMWLNACLILLLLAHDSVGEAISVASETLDEVVDEDVLLFKVWGAGCERATARGSGNSTGGL